MKVLFFPGLGADATLSRYHALPGHDVAWIQWPKRIPADWELFLNRIIAENPVDEGACYVGISFGGLVAARLAMRKRPSKILLVGSLRSSHQVRPLLRIPGWTVAAAPRIAFDLSLVPTAVISYFFGITRPEHLDHFRSMASGIALEDIKAMARLVLGAPPVHGLGIPVKSIHGEKDRLLPIALQAVDRKVTGGGHLVSMTHAEEVNQALMEWIG